MSATSSLWRRRLVNAYEVKACIGVIADNKNCLIHDSSALSVKYYNAI